MRSDAGEKAREKVVAYRRQAGSTQAGVAEKVGVDVKTISRLERGSVVPSPW
jgi:DNA-binding XRE family transcriptional regulator